MSTCLLCKDSSLCNDDIWIDMDVPQIVNTGMHDRINGSAYMQVRYSVCYGCFKLARRRVKILAALLNKLKVKV